MARKRMIDPTIWEDEDFGKLTMGAKILFIGLFSNADDEGRIRANVSYLKSTIFMYEDITLEDVKSAREQVCEYIKNVKFYEIDGKEYIQLLSWDKYQKQHKDRVLKSTLPTYEDNVSDNVGQVPTEDKLSKDKLSKDKLSKDSITNTNVLVGTTDLEIDKPTDPINHLISLFSGVNPSYKRMYANKTQRDALTRLITEHGEQKIARAVLSLPQINGKKYAPVITTPYELETKLGQLFAYLQREGQVDYKFSVTKV